MWVKVLSLQGRGQEEGLWDGERFFILTPQARGRPRPTAFSCSPCLFPTEPSRDQQGGPLRPESRVLGRLTQLLESSLQGQEHL